MREESSQRRFLEFFEKIKVDFYDNGADELYPKVEWTKAKSQQSGSFDCFEIVRSISKDQKKKL